MANSSFIDEIATALSSGLKTQTLTTCSRWAEARRVMSGDFAGNYGFKYHPWAKEPHDSEASFNVSMKAAQMGFTEIGINRAFFTLDVARRDVLYVLPTALNAGDFSRTRFSPALALSPYIKSMFTDVNTVNLKQAGSKTLYIRGSRGDSNLKSIPVSELILDEVDEMGQDALWLAFERLSGQLTKNIWAISTPTIPDRGIHKLYQGTTQEHFFFTCPICSRKTELIWPDSFKVCGDTITDKDLVRSHLLCIECKKPLRHEDKPDYLSSGFWHKTNYESDPDQRGFNVNQLYSFTVTPNDIAVAYMRGLSDAGAMTEFYKSKVGKPYIPPGGKITDSKIDNCLRNHTMDDDRPKSGGKRFITMGVDQGDWMYCWIDEWFSVDGQGDINSRSKPKTVCIVKFNAKIEGSWDRLDQLMREWQVLGCVIDADPNTLEARRFAQRFHGYVTLCRYRRGVPQRSLKMSEDENDVMLATVDRTNWLDCSLGRFHTGNIELPCDIQPETRTHLQNLVRTYEKDDDGNMKATYMNTGPDHFAHARTYSEIALPLAASHTYGEDIEAFL